MLREIRARSPIITSRRYGFRSRTRRCRPGCICRPITSSGTIPAVIVVPGHGQLQGDQVALYGDRWLNRGIAVLAIDGPGQYEAPMLGIHVSMENWIAAGPALVDWLVARPETRSRRASASPARSFGSFFGTDLAANEPRYPPLRGHRRPASSPAATRFSRRPRHLQKALHVHVGLYRRGGVRRILQQPHLGRPCRENPLPYLCVAGEAEELSPLQHSEGCWRAFKAPKHAGGLSRLAPPVGNVPAANLGPFPPILLADWLADRLAPASLSPASAGTSPVPVEINKTAY